MKIKQSYELQLLSMAAQKEKEKEAKKAFDNFVEYHRLTIDTALEEIAPQMEEAARKGDFYAYLRVNCANFDVLKVVSKLLQAQGYKIEAAWRTSHHGSYNKIYWG